MPQHQDFLAFFQDLAALFTHGMRNRLTPAKTGAELLGESESASSPKIQTATEYILNSLVASLHLLDELDALWRIMPSEPQRGRMGDLVSQKAAKHDVAAAVEDSLDELAFDRQLWGVIVDEILANVKVHGGGSVQVACTGAGSDIELRFEDQGPGLGSMLPERALEATRRSETSKGAGMGFSKVAYAALLLDGTVRLEPAQPGLRVVVTAAPHSTYIVQPKLPH